MNKLLLVLALLAGCVSTPQSGTVKMFGAPWCGYCRQAKPKLMKLASDLNYEFVDVDTDTDSVAGYYFRSIPRVAIYRAGSHELVYFGYPTDNAISEAEEVLK